MGYKHNKEDIISAGSELFRSQSYHQVGINDILKSCGIPKGSFYNFFESKEDFAAQVLDYYAGGNLVTVKAALESDDRSPLQRIKDFYSTMIDFNIADGCSKGCLINNLSIELGGNNDLLSGIANEKFQEVVKLLTRTVKEGQELGEIMKEQEATELAEYLHSGFFGALARMKVNKNAVYLKKWHKMTFQLISN